MIEFENQNFGDYIDPTTAAAAASTATAATTATV